MSSDAAVRVESLAKAYRMYAKPRDRLKQMMWRGRRKFYHEFWALHELSLSVAKGECVAFLGKNGSGKSTLLQMIAGTLEPTRGRLSVSGRVSALLELGAGFNPEFTGRENALLKGALLGVSDEEMRRRLPAILEFSELGDFIDKPVKIYSSGMFVRLAFSVAVHVEPEVLLVDEALSVGDAAFQYKCMERIKLLRSRGMSILFVTHDTSAVRKICDRAFWLDSGNLVASGPANDIADQYDSFNREKTYGAQERPAAQPEAKEQAAPAASAPAQPQEKVAAHVVKASLKDRNGSPVDVVCVGSELHVCVEYSVKEQTSGLVIGVAFLRNDDLYVSGLNTGIDRFVVPHEIGSHSVILTLPKVNLLGGDYYCKVGVFDETGMVSWDFVDRCCPFRVTGPYLAGGVMVPEHEWSVVAA